MMKFRSYEASGELHPGASKLYLNTRRLESIHSISLPPLATMDLFVDSSPLSPNFVDLLGDTLTIGGNDVMSPSDTKQASACLV